MVKFTYWFIDSWDAGIDHGQVSISSDDVTYTSIWTKYAWTQNGTANLIQQTSSSYNDQYVKDERLHNTAAIYYTCASTHLALVITTMNRSV